MAERRNVKSDDNRAADEHERGRDYLGQMHLNQLFAAAKKGRHGIWDHLLILMMFRHGLRVSETISLRQEDVDLAQSRLWIERLKNGLSVEQPIPGHVHPHMLRHSCGFALASRGNGLRLIQDYLGHRDPRHTAHYTRTAVSRFDGLW